MTSSQINRKMVAGGRPAQTGRPNSVVLGVGCSIRATPDEVETLARSALAETGCTLATVVAVATIDSHVTHPAVAHLASQARRRDPLGFSVERLATVADVPTPSPEVARHVGTLSVCEAAAILGSDGGKLLVPKRKSAHATVAVAEISSQSEER